MTAGDAQRIESPNAAESAWIARNVELAASLASRYGAGPGVVLDPAVLDRVVVGWVGDSSPQRPAPNDVCNAIGLAFGQWLVGRLEMKWAVVTDEHGTDIAVHSEPGSVLVFPTSAVAKRLSSKEVPFLRDLYDQMAADIAEVRREFQ